MNGTWILFVIYILMIVVDAWGDVEQERGNLKRRHILEAIVIFLALSVSYVYAEYMFHGLLDAVVILLCGYTVNRWMWFDVAHNLIKGDPVMYIGSNSWYDIIQGHLRNNKFFSTWPDSGIFAIKIVIWIAGAGTILLGNYFRWFG